jgi:hypothetical protein
MSDITTIDLPTADNDDGIALGHYAQRAYLEYALSVVKGRALPDVCDGQKPVQRRILYSMSRMGLGFSGNTGAKPVKSARVVGDVLGRYHPHGDSAAYEALVRMAQDFAQRYPLIDGQGNFGSRDGDGAAAMRYTEARLAKITTLLLDEISEISPRLQAKLLRVLQEREFERVGGTKTIQVDVRVLATTNRDLRKSVEKGDFREDLYYRLNVFPVSVPPLRDARTH